MLSAEVPENDTLNAKQAKKDAAKAKAPQEEMMAEMDDMEEMMSADGGMDQAHILQCKANIIVKAQEYLADPDLMKKLQPLLDKKTKALKGLAGLKQKLSDAQLREMKKGES